MSTLCAGYWTGEFGWELMQWQGKIRHIAPHYDMVIVGCQKGHEFLYSDFSYHFETYSDDSPNRNMWMSNGATKKLEMVDSELVSPSRDFCTNDFYHQTFTKYGKETKGYDFEILIHARSQDNMHTEYRNWPTENWD